MHHTDKYSQHRLIIWSIWLNNWVFVYEWNGCCSNPIAVTQNWYIAPVSSKELLDNWRTTNHYNKRVCDMIKTYSHVFQSLTKITMFQQTLKFSGLKFSHLRWNALTRLCVSLLTLYLSARNEVFIYSRKK